MDQKEQSMSLEEQLALIQEFAQTFSRVFTQFVELCKTAIKKDKEVQKNAAFNEGSTNFSDQVQQRRLQRQSDNKLRKQAGKVLYETLSKETPVPESAFQIYYSEIKQQLMQEHADISDDQLPTIAFLRYKKLIDSEREIYECKFEYFKAKRDSRTKTDIVGEKRARKINEKNSRAIQKGLEDEAEPYAATLPLDQAEVPHATQISDDYQKVPKQITCLEDLFDHSQESGPRKQELNTFGRVPQVKPEASESKQLQNQEQEESRYKQTSQEQAQTSQVTPVPQVTNQETHDIIVIDSTVMEANDF